MTLMPSGMQPLKADVLGRVRTPAAKQDEILDEFERSGVSGVEFAKLIGVKYATFAAWSRRRRGKEARSPKRRHSPKAPVEFVEAVVPRTLAQPMEVELPRNVRVRFSTAAQIPLVIELLRSLESC